MSSRACSNEPLTDELVLDLMTASPFSGTRYRPIRQLAEGAMGEVWEVEHRELGSRFAAKVISHKVAHRGSVSRRMQSEGRALAKLKHLNLVRVTDMAPTRDGRWFFVMDLLDGHDLEAHLQRCGTLTVDEAIDIACQALAGLAHAHHAGIVHRDIKPANIFCCRPEREDGPYVVKLVDFGVAKHTGPGGSGGVRTDTGVVIGTPRYLSPEQARGEKVGPRADLYALALVLYRMLVGAGPFDHHRGLVGIMAAHLDESPAAPSSHRAKVPQALDRAILKALSKDPAQRFHNAEEFAAALRGAVSGVIIPDAAPSGTLASRDRPPRSREGGAATEATAETLVPAMTADAVTAPLDHETLERLREVPLHDATQPFEAFFGASPTTRPMDAVRNDGPLPESAVDRTLVSGPAEMAPTAGAVYSGAALPGHDAGGTSTIYRLIVLSAVLATIVVVITLGVGC